MSASQNQEFLRRARKNRSVRLEAITTTTYLDEQQKWQSIGAFGADELTQFGRLKKSYASMRKSFRLNALLVGSSEKSRENSNFEAQLDAVRRQDTYSSLYSVTPSYDQHADNKQRNLIGNLGSNAAKLLRNVYVKNSRSHNTATGGINSSSGGATTTRTTGGRRRYDLERNLDDAIGQATSGSFRVISSQGAYGSIGDSSSSPSSSPPQRQTQAHQRKKTEAELAIEQRLKRSKGRVLPSAKYEAPNGERACDGLNLRELEEIKRDNLRQTLTRSQQQYSSLSPVDSVKQINHQIDHLDEEREQLRESDQRISGLHPLDELLCSCKSLIPDHNVDDLGDDQDLCADHLIDGGARQPADQRPQTFCSCASISSSFSSINQCGDSIDELTQIQVADREQPDRDQLSGQRRARDGRVTVVSLTAAAATNDDYANKTRSESRASGGLGCQVVGGGGSKLSFFKQRVEHRVEREVGDRKEQEPQKQRLVGVGCGEREDEQQVAPSVKLAPGQGDEQPSGQQQAAGKQAHQSEQQQQVVVVRNLHKSGGSSGGSPNGNNSLGGVTLAQIASQQVSSQVSGKSNSANHNNDGADHHHEGAAAAAAAECQVIAIAQRQSPVAAGLAAERRDNKQQQVACSSFEQRVVATSGAQSSVGGKFRVASSHKIIPNQQAPVGQSEVESGERNNVEFTGEVANQRRPNGRGALEGEQREQTETNHNVKAQQQSEEKSICDEQADDSKWMRRQRRREEIMMSLSQVDLSNFWHQAPDGLGKSRAAMAAYDHHQYNTNQRLYNAKSYVAMNERSIDCDRLQQVQAPAGGPDQHLYASVCGSPTPSPDDHYSAVMANHHQHHHAAGHYSQLSDELHWHQQSSHRPEGERRLFDRQLSVGGRQQQHYLQRRAAVDAISSMAAQGQDGSAVKQQKRSLLSRLKHFIAPGSNKIQHQPEVVAEVSAPLSAGGGQKLRWQKSRTLTSKSTQNLLNSSMRLLSTSRKSMNLVVGQQCDEEDNNDNTRKSLVSGFLTLGRKSQSKKEPIGQHLFNKLDQSVDHHHHHHQLARGRRVFGSADSLPSADSGLSCNNLQTSSSSETEQYSTALRVATTCGNLYTLSSSSGCASNDLSDSIGGSSLTATGVVTSGRGDGRQLVVGQAVAKVDCNPCAYDKEALVFKQGDLIDILERNESGTWIGQCNGRVGHFKFINVTEITTPTSKTNKELDELEEAEERRGGSGGGYVTKLEIKSNEQQVGASAITKRPLSLSMSTIDASGGRQSGKSREQPHQLCEQRQQEQHHQPTRPLNDKLSGSSETIMSSLEQLLFAIGLAGEQVNLADAAASVPPTNLSATSDHQLIDRCGHYGEQREQEENDYVTVGELTTTSGSDHNHNKHSDCHLNGHQSASLSYLEVLSKSGINNLDSFGNIHELEELEQIGILDDEHQRRLLMAARIIRQASRAARMDFVGDYRTKSSIIGSAGEHQQASETTPRTVASKSNESDSSNKSVARASNGQQAESLSDNNLLPPPQLATKSDNNVNEPIYVNLLDLERDSSPSPLRKSETGQDQDQSARMKVQRVSGKTHEPVKRGDLSAALDGRSRPKSQTSRRHFQDQRELNSISGQHNVSSPSTSPGATSGRLRLGLDSINGLDSRPAHRLSGREANFRSTTSCCHTTDHEIDGHSDWWDGSESDDDQSDDGRREAAGVDVITNANTTSNSNGRPAAVQCSPLTRGYSMRASVRNSLGGCKLVGQSKQPTCASSGRQVPPTRRSLISVGRRAPRQANLQQQQHQSNHQATPRSNYPLAAGGNNRNRLLPPPPAPSAAQLASRSRQYHNHNSSSSAANGQQKLRGSQAHNPSSNSTSAYDLRLDLSHFFS